MKRGRDSRQESDTNKNKLLSRYDWLRLRPAKRDARKTVTRRTEQATEQEPERNKKFRDRILWKSCSFVATICIFSTEIGFDNRKTSYWVWVKCRFVNPTLLCLLLLHITSLPSLYVAIKSFEIVFLPSRLEFCETKFKQFEGTLRHISCKRTHHKPLKYSCGEKSLFTSRETSC